MLTDCVSAHIWPVVGDASRMHTMVFLVFASRMGPSNASALRRFFPEIEKMVSELLIMSPVAAHGFLFSFERHNELCEEISESLVRSGQLWESFHLHMLCVFMTQSRSQLGIVLFQESFQPIKFHWQLMLGLVYSGPKQPNLG